MHILKSVGVMSVARIMGLLYGCLGLIFAPIFLLIGLMGSLVGKDKTPFAGIFGVVFAVLMPLIYGAVGFVTGAISAFLYNVLARWMGGVELELEPQSATVVASYPIVPPPTPAI
jgi:hypothetical protein